MITSRPYLDSTPKVLKSHTYRPASLSCEKVYELAQHFYTLEEIAAFFKVTKNTLIAHTDIHEAFLAGKEDAKMMPRMLLRKIMTDFSLVENLADMKTPTGTLLKALELHARKYEGLADKVVVSENKYDAVESAPIIIERPTEDEQ